jgi:hypothetical protein
VVHPVDVLLMSEPIYEQMIWERLVEQEEDDPPPPILDQ